MNHVTHATMVDCEDLIGQQCTLVTQSQLNILKKCSQFPISYSNNKMSLTLIYCVCLVSVLVLVIEVFPWLPLPFGILSLLISAIVVQ